MFSRRKSVAFTLSCSSIYLAFILSGLSDAASPGRRPVITDGDGEKFIADTMESILNEINDLRQEVIDETEFFRDTETVVETTSHDFIYAVETRLELIQSDRIGGRFRRDDNGQWTDDTRRSSTTVRKGSEEEVAVFVHEMLSMLEEVDSNREPGFYTGWIEQDTRNASTKSTRDTVMGRFRRNDKASMTHDGSPKDYMSTYYAQRKAIMDKYKLQQREIMERVKKTKSFIAEAKKLKESKKIYFDKSNETQNQPSVFLHSNITRFADHSSTIAPDPMTSSVDLSQKSTSPSPEVPIIDSTILNHTRITSLNDSESFFNSSDYESADYSTEVDPSNTTLTPIRGTLRPFVNEKIEIIDRPDVEDLERDWPSESVNLIPQNGVDFNLTEQSLIRQERDNETVIFNLGGQQLAIPPSKNDSALDQLEKMFLWEVPVADERIPRIDGESRVKNVNTISENDRLENSSQPSDSLRFMVEIKSSPEVQVTKNIKNVQTSTTIYRNSTHEIVEVNGVVNSTNRIDGENSLDVDIPSYLKNKNLTNVAESESGGGARESEWCEKCPHDYTWGNCDGTLFYQHNIFLRNRGPSAIDAIFGMNVQGPVSITCVEAIRFNQTRGIVTLHSGGQGHDFAKLRIRGFQGEGFSYIIKVWGSANEEIIDGSNYSY